MAEMAETNALLRELIAEVSDLRADLSDFTNKIVISDLDDVLASVEALGARFDELGDRLTGAFSGSTGNDLTDIVRSLGAVEDAIERAK